MIMNQINPHRQYYKQERAEIARLIVGQPKTILDVGCGSGCFKRNISWNCDYYGVEPVHEAACDARSVGIAVYEGLYQDVAGQIPDGMFDMIVCNDVIEHMVDPWMFLEGLKRKLAPGGYVIGSLPNVRYLLNLRDLLLHRDWPYADAGVLDRTHLRFFTLKSARRLFNECHYEIDVLRPSGPDRFDRLKKVLSPLFLLAGTDVLYMQMAFRLKPTEG